VTNSNEKDEVERRRPGDFAILEKHIWSIFGPVTVALLIWVGYSVAQNRQDLAVMATQMSAMQTQMAYVQTQLTSATTDRYRSADAARDLAAIIKTLEMLTNEVKEIGKEQASRGPRILRLEQEVERCARYLPKEKK